MEESRNKGEKGVKYCSECGKPSRIDAKFCYHCGHDFSQDEIEVMKEGVEEGKEIIDKEEIESLEILKVKAYPTVSLQDLEERENSSNIQEKKAYSRRSIIFPFFVSLLLMVVGLMLGEYVATAILKRTDPLYIIKASRWQKDPSSIQAELNALVEKYNKKEIDSKQLFERFVSITGVDGIKGLIRVTFIPLLISILMLLVSAILSCKLFPELTPIYIGISGGAAFSFLFISQGNFLTILFAFPIGFFSGWFFASIYLKLTR